jgi:hypothetical protein
VECIYLIQESWWKKERPWLPCCSYLEDDVKASQRRILSKSMRSPIHEYQSKSAHWATFSIIDSTYCQETASYQDLWDVQQCSWCKGEKDEEGINIHVWRLWRSSVHCSLLQSISHGNKRLKVTYTALRQKIQVCCVFQFNSLGESLNVFSGKWPWNVHW